MSRLVRATGRAAVVCVGLVATLEADGVASRWPGGVEVLASQPAVVRVATAAALHSDRTGGSLEVSILAALVPRGEGALAVSVITQVGAAALAGNVKSPLELESFVYAFDEGGNLAAQSCQRVAVEPSGRRHFGDRGLTILSSLELPAGRYSVRALVRRDGGELFALRQLELWVPETPVGTAVLLPPWLLEPLGSRIVALPATGGPPLSGIRPLAVDGELRFPSAGPVLEAGGSGLGCLWALHVGDGPWLVLARFERESGETVAEVPASLAAGPILDRDGLTALPLTWQVPDLPEGRYLLRYVLESPSGTVSSPPLQVLVVPEMSGKRFAGRGVGLDPVAAG